jgi:hypothetical protein
VRVSCGFTRKGAQRSASSIGSPSMIVSLSSEKQSGGKPLHLRRQRDGDAVLPELLLELLDAGVVLPALSLEQ